MDLDSEIFCEFPSAEFRQRNGVLQRKGIQIQDLPEEVLDLLFIKKYSEEELWYLLASFHAYKFTAEDIYSFLRDVEFDDDCCDVLDGYFNADQEFFDQLMESAYYSFKEKRWMNEDEKDEEDLSPPKLQRSESVYVGSTIKEESCQEIQEKQPCADCKLESLE